MSNSVLDSTIVQAYRETDYRVLVSPSFSLRVDEYSAELVDLHWCHRVDCSAFVSGCNPFSRLVDEGVNRELQMALAEDLQTRGLVFIRGAGQHPSNGWPAEESFLVLGLELDAAKALGVQYQQNAIVWNGPDGVAQLILLR